MEQITHQRLLESLSFDPETGAFTWAQPRKRVVAGAVAGSLAPSGYRVVKLNQRAYYEHRLAWFYVHKEWPKEEIDHINGVRHDNRIENLREASHSQNHQNKPSPSTNKSGKKGVSWSEKDGAWRARVKLSGVEVFLGNYSNIQDADAAVRAAREKLHGEFSNHGNA